MRPVVISETSKQQTLNDGHFGPLAQLPTTALTLTMPALMSAGQIVGVVPGWRRHNALQQALTAPSTTRAGLLRCAGTATARCSWMQKLQGEAVNLPGPATALNFGLVPSAPTAISYRTSTAHRGHADACEREISGSLRGLSIVGRSL